jgi:hypothetical protein
MGQGPSKAYERDRSAQAETASSEPGRRPAPRGPQSDVLALQRDAGNRAVDEWLQPSAGESAQVGNGVPPIVADVLRSGSGQPLDASTRAEMEARFGEDFSQVRLHADARAARSAQSVDALAYTVRHNIVFGAGQPTLTADAGRRLLAHELAHVVQQTRGGARVHPGAERSLEQDAESASNSVIHGREPVQVAQAGPAGIARQAKAAATSGESKPVSAKYSVSETLLNEGRVRIRVWGTVGDPIDRPGLEKKYPLPKDVGLAGYDRWHLAGPDAIGAEEGIVYAPENFNLSRTAEIENIVRKARAAVREQGGDVYFDFTAECRVVGEYEGVQIRVLEKVTWKAEVRLAGSDRTIPIVNLTDSPAVSPAPKAVPPPTPSSSAVDETPEAAIETATNTPVKTQGPKAAGSKPANPQTASPVVKAPPAAPKAPPVAKGVPSPKGEAPQTPEAKAPGPTVQKNPPVVQAQPAPQETPPAAEVVRSPRGGAPEAAKATPAPPTRTPSPVVRIPEAWTPSPLVETVAAQLGAVLAQIADLMQRARIKQGVVEKLVQQESEFCRFQQEHPDQGYLIVVAIRKTYNAGLAQDDQELAHVGFQEGSTSQEEATKNYMKGYIDLDYRIERLFVWIPSHNDLRRAGLYQ